MARYNEPRITEYGNPFSLQGSSLQALMGQGVLSRMDPTSLQGVLEMFLGSPGGGLGEPQPSIDAGIPGWQDPEEGSFTDSLSRAVMGPLAGAFPVVRASDDPAQAATLSRYGVEPVRSIPQAVAVALQTMTMVPALPAVMAVPLAIIAQIVSSLTGLNDPQGTTNPGALAGFGFDPSNTSPDAMGALGGFGGFGEGGMTGFGGIGEGMSLSPDADRSLAEAIADAMGAIGGMTGYDGGSSSGSDGPGASGAGGGMTGDASGIGGEGSLY